MNRRLNDSRSDAEIIRTAADSIDYEKLRAQAHLSPTEKLQLLFELCDQARQKVFDEEQTKYPNETEEMILRRVRDRTLDEQDLSDKVRADVKEWIRRKENETIAV